MELETLLGSIFINDAVLPSQFYSKPADPFPGERLLWACVLEDAVSCVMKCPPDFISGFGGAGQGNNNRSRLYGLEARAWFASDDTALGSFLFICEVLDLEPEALRRRVGEGITPERTRRSPVCDTHGVTFTRSRARRPQGARTVPNGA